jgi:microcystin-dependent protein
MSQPFVGEIRMFPGNFAPQGWAFCDGSLLAIDQNTVLFELIGTTYGGDGQQTFALPDLRGRVPVHQGNGFVIGQSGGSEIVTLTVSQLPAHSHVPQANNAGGSDNPSGNVWAKTNAKAYSNQAPNAAMNAAALGSVGGGQPHDNLMPFLTVNFILSLFGIFPSQN